MNVLHELHSYLGSVQRRLGNYHLVGSQGVSATRPAPAQAVLSQLELVRLPLVLLAPAAELAQHPCLDCIVRTLLGVLGWNQIRTDHPKQKWRRLVGFSLLLFSRSCLTYKCQSQHAQLRPGLVLDTVQGTSVVRTSTRSTCPTWTA